MLFEWLDPNEIVQVSANEPAKSMRKFERFESDTAGRAFDLSGQVSNADGSRVWASYSKGPGLLEFDLTTNKIKTLIGGPSGAYALSVRTEDGRSGEVLTGGADGYVRLWKLDDLSLIKEYKVAKPEQFVSDALLVPGSRRAVVAVMRMDWQTASLDEQIPVEVVLLDLETGQQRKLFDIHGWRTRLALVDDQIVYAEMGRIKFATIEGVKTKREFNLNTAIMQTAVSANGRWLAVIDYSKKLTVFDLTTGRKRTISIKDEHGGPVVITNEGRHVYRAVGEGSLTTWDMSNGKTTTTRLIKVSEMHSRVDYMTLAHDDRWLVTCGNHRDLAIFDRTTLRLLFIMQNAAAAHFVEKVWIKGDRLIMTSDTGVMHSGVIK
jgi:WD40 repeat protein